MLIVDDHELFRTGLAELLGQEGLKIAGAVADGASALDIVVQCAPDVVLMDLEMPGLSGVETTRRIAEIAPRTRVVVLTIDAEEQSVFDAIAAGACGYLIKGTSLQSVVAGIRAAVAGESLISAAVGAKLFERLRAEDRRTAAERRVFDDLSEREIEILKLLAGGKRNAEIGQQLFISPHTVRNHISNILAKLQISNRIEAAGYAIRNRMV
ncbi:MAG: response regulator transcription factor [Actinobacteria bacterium]|nr:MAG: response regulator transcription factor [Actinomycetota bacterium]